MAFGHFDSGASSGTMSEINMVPLIDVMLVLLVIFIITAPLLSHSIQINVPQVSAQPLETEPKVVDVAVDAAGVVYWDEQPIPLEALPDYFAQAAQADPQPQVRIRADGETRYVLLAEVMAAARQAGIKRLGFVTRPGDSSAPAAPAAAPSAPAAP